MRNSRKLGATGSLWWESVVALNLRFVLNTKLTSFCSTSATNDHALTVKYGLIPIVINNSINGSNFYG